MMTLLDMTNHILSSIGAEAVPSINATVEAGQVVDIIEQTWLTNLSRLNPKRREGMFEFLPSLSSAKPTMMYIPDYVEEVLWVKYNKRKKESSEKKFEDLRYLHYKDFVDLVYSYDITKPNVGSYQIEFYPGDTFDVLYKNDKHPDYYTTINDNIILFDSYYNYVDSTIQNEHTIGYGKLRPRFEREDTWVFPLHHDEVALILEEAKLQAHVEMLQQANPLAEYRAKRLFVTSQAQDPHVHNWSYEHVPNRLPSYGRAGPRRRSS